MYLFMTLPVDFILSFRLTVKLYPSTVLHGHIRTCSSVYLFSLFLLFWHNLHNDLSTRLMAYLHTDPPENKFTCSPLFFSFRTECKTEKEIKEHKWCETKSSDSGVGTLVVLALSLCLSVPRRIQNQLCLSKANANGDAMNPQYIPFNQWWIGPTR